MIDLLATIFNTWFVVVFGTFGLLLLVMAWRWVLVIALVAVVAISSQISDSTNRARWKAEDRAVYQSTVADQAMPRLVPLN